MPDRETCREAVVSNDYKDFIFGYYDRREILENSRINCYQIVNRNYAVVHYYDPNLVLGEGAEYYYAQIPKAYGLLQQENLEEIGVSRLRRLNGFDYYGQGVLLGFVDTGIDYTHPAFLRADGTSRVISIWDQNDQTGSPPADFIYGTEFDEAAIAAEEAPKDEIGHGTALAGIAGGKPDAAGNFYGVASQAEIAVVKLKPIKPYLREYYFIPEDTPAYSETDLMLGVRYLVELARRRNQPLVVCIGLGTTSGNHTGSLPFSRYLSSLSYDLDLCLVLAAGNEGNARHHFSGQVSRERKEVELQVGREPEGFTLELWASPISNIRIGIVSPSGERVELPNLIKYTQRYSFIFDRTTVFVEYERQERSSNARLVLFRFAHPSSGIWRILIDGSEELLGEYNLWLPLTGFVDENTYFLEPDPYVTICEPGNAPLPIALTGYNARNGGFYTESSRGFSGDGQIRPTIAAPAVNITVPQAGGYTVKSGTSLAAAYTSGCAAVFFEYILEYRRRNTDATELSSEEVRTENLSLDTVLMRDLFANGARREENMVYPNREWGYGKLDLYGMFLRLQN
ncbi:MAG: S8 family peptidase [Lachnospiraceae bacterium]